MLNGETMVFNQNPVIQNDRVMVPLRKIFESLDASVSWDQESQAITAVKEGSMVKLTIGSSEAYLNGSLITLDQPPVIINARTLVPIRFVSEALGARVEWVPETKMVQIYSRAAEGISCSALGMIPDDESKGYNNYKLLLAEAKKGTKINVDGTYYLHSPYGDSSNENEVNSGLFLTGESPATSKLILTGNSYFKIKGSALIENISIECPKTDFVSYLITMTAPFVNDVTIRNNYITGNIKLISSLMPSNFNFASTPCYLKQLVVEGNEIFDVYVSSGAPLIISLNNTPVKSSYIRNNKVTNFSYVFYGNGVTNDHPSENYLLENTNAVIENNQVLCTDDYNVIAKNNGYISMYHCFALIEGFDVECRNNTFEGFHMSDAPGTYVYDNYFNVTKLLYEGNTWKNIVNFTPGNVGVDIMKSKGAHKVAGVKTERIYRNNTYIVEPGYADKFGKDRFLLRKEINTYAVDIDRIIIEDNYFDMYILSFRGPTFKELYQFNRNTVLTDTIEHSVTWQALVYNKDMKDSSGNFIPRNIIFTNNNITCDSKAFGQGIGTSRFYLILNNTTSGDKTVIDFSNNNIKIPDFIFDPSDLTKASNTSTSITSFNNIINDREVK
jgi:hypothetical protein